MDKQILVENLSPLLGESVGRDRPAMLIGVDKSSPPTSFTLAMCVWKFGAPRQTMRLWEIRLLSDSRTLEAAIPSTLILDHQSCSPQGDILYAEAGLLVQGGTGRLGSTLEIIDWNRSTPTMHFKAAILQENGAQAFTVYFVNKADTVLILGYDSITMYDVPEFKGLPIQALPRSSSPGHGPRWTYQFQNPGLFQVLSPPLYSSLGRLSFAIWADRLRLFSTSDINTPPVCSWEGFPYERWINTQDLGPTRGALFELNSVLGRVELYCLTYLPATSANQHLVDGTMKSRFSAGREWIVSEGECVLHGCNDSPYDFELDEASGRMISRHNTGDGLVMIWDFAH
ncbi:hypothetical protein FRB95_005196 [Tulasnella sp. JGI-2019a]|nr:hypothetical protein FRB95_005196 [Tulasnella sp. JGI-2019a]